MSRPLPGGRTRWVITATVVGVLTVVLLAVSGVAMLLGSRAADEAAQERAFAQLVLQAGELRRGVDPAVISREFPFQVTDAGGRVVVASTAIIEAFGDAAVVSGDPPDGSGDATDGGTVSYESTTVTVPPTSTSELLRPGRQVDALSTDVSVPGASDVRLTVLVTDEAAKVDRAELLRFLALAGAVVLALVALAAWLSVGAALRPVERMRRQVDAVPATDRDGRLVVPPTHDEIEGLALTFNRALARIAAARRREEELVGDAAHELRQPLASMVSSLEVLDTYGDAVDRSALTASALRQARHLGVVAEQLLVLSRLDAGEGPSSDQGSVPLEGVIAQSAERAGARVPVHLELSLHGAMVAAGPVPFSLVLDNLMSNAARHARSQITVTGSYDAASSRAVVEVGNDGDPIDPEQLDRIFERFVRLDEARDRDSGGTGLGLAIARRAAEAHGGSISVSNDEHGVRFTVELVTVAVPADSADGGSTTPTSAQVAE